MKRLRELLERIRNRGSEKTTPPPFTVELWCARYLDAKDEQTQLALCNELASANLTREEIIFLIAAFKELDTKVIETILAMEQQITFSGQDILDTLDHEYWSAWLREYAIEFLKLHPKK
jgi:hypothetical protein